MHIMSLHVLAKDEEPQRVWFVVVETGTGMTTDDQANLLRVFNDWGQDGWLIGSADFVEKGKNLDVPGILLDQMQKKFGRWHEVRRYERRMIQRAVVWPS